MFGDLQNKYDWVLKILNYRDVSQLVRVMDEAIIAQTEDMHRKLRLRKARGVIQEHADDYEEESLSNGEQG